MVEKKIPLCMFMFQLVLYDHYSKQREEGEEFIALRGNPPFTVQQQLALENPPLFM